MEIGQTTLLIIILDLVEYRTSKTSDKPTRKEYDAWIKAAQSERLDVSDLKFEKCGKADFRYPTIP